MSATKWQTAVPASTVLGNFAQFGTWVVVTQFLLAITGAVAVIKSDIGLVLTLLWGTFALLQFLNGVLADRYGERPVNCSRSSRQRCGACSSPSLPRS